MFVVRQAVAEDIPFLLRVLAIAADWQPGVEPRAVVAVLASPDLAHYVPDLGARDRGLVMQDEVGNDVGAAWWRFFEAADPGYGFVARDVPEVTVGLLPASRRRGLGNRLLVELIALARTEELPALSLSVEPENFAARLYRASASFRSAPTAEPRPCCCRSSTTHRWPSRLTEGAVRDVPRRRA